MLESAARSAAGQLLRIGGIAAGGMGYVELVLRVEGTFRRLYARKRLHEHYRSDEELRQMFLEEARVAGLLRHPNVIGVLDVGEDEEGPFLVMDFVDGFAISGLIADARQRDDLLPIGVCVEIARQTALALHAAHELVGIDGAPLRLVHRDVSPQNVLVDFDGTVRLGDFGVAKALGRAVQSTTDALKGKVGYMSPEQLRFEALDRRSDLFSLGVVLYELLAADRLYGGREVPAIARRILDEPPPDVGEVRSDVPPSLEELLLDLLAKDRDQRPVDAAIVARRLGAIATDTGEGALELAALMNDRFGARRAVIHEERARAIERAESSPRVAAADVADTIETPPVRGDEIATTRRERVARARIGRAAVVGAVLTGTLAAAVAAVALAGSSLRDGIPPPVMAHGRAPADATAREGERGRVEAPPRREIARVDEAAREDDAPRADATMPVDETMPVDDAPGVDTTMHVGETMPVEETRPAGERARAQPIPTTDPRVVVHAPEDPGATASDERAPARTRARGSSSPRVRPDPAAAAEPAPAAARAGAAPQRARDERLWGWPR